MSGARRASRGLTALLSAALVVALTAPAAGAQQTEEPRLPTELWKTYPLDPTKKETGEQPVGGGAATTTEPSPPAVTPTARGGRQTPRADGGTSLAVLLAAALGGLALLLALGFAVVVARRRGLLVPPRLRLPRVAVLRSVLDAARSVPASAVVPARRLVRSAATVRPPRRLRLRRVAVLRSVLDAARSVPASGVVPARRIVRAAATARPMRPRAPRRLGSEGGSLVPFATPGAPEKRTEPSGPKKLSRREPPPQKPLPGLAPPPAKEKQVRSGLPPGKTVPRPAEPRPREETVATPPPTGLNPAPASAAVGASHHARRVEPVRPALGAPGVTARAEACEIDWWRGYVRSEFYAFALRRGGTATVLARSPSFRWRASDPPPPEGPAREAHAALVEQLSGEGWEPVGTGSLWYRTRLHRRLKPTLPDLADSGGRGAG